MRHAKAPANTFGSVVRAAALALVLLAAEAFAVVHPFDLDAHSTGEPCKICISVVSFDSAAPAKVVTLTLDAARHVPGTAFTSVAGPRPFFTRFARGPPAAS